MYMCSITTTSHSDNPTASHPGQFALMNPQLGTSRAFPVSASFNSLSLSLSSLCLSVCIFSFLPVLSVRVQLLLRDVYWVVLPHIQGIELHDESPPAQATTM